MRLPLFWQQLAPRTRHWLLNIAWGLAIELCLILFHGYLPLEQWQNASLDAVMRLNSGGHEPPALPLAVLNVDDSSWRSRSWGGGEPSLAPRAELLQLIDYAMKHGSRYVVVDILIEGRPSADDEDFAKGLAARLDSGRWRPDQHLIFARSVREPLDPLRFGPEMRSSVLDGVFAKHRENTHLAAPYFRHSADGVLRDWELWRIVCGKPAPASESRWMVLPSVQLLVAMLNAQPLAFPLEPLDGDCRMCTEAGNGISAEQNSKRLELHDKVQQWAFRNAGVSHPGKAHEGGAGAALSNRIVYDFASFDDKRITVIPVQDALADNASAAAELDGAVTIIGHSFQESGDIHTTPMGVMSGPLVILNSINSMLKNKEAGSAFRLLMPLNPMAAWPITMAFIVIVGYAYARWNSVKGTLFATLCALLLMPFANFAFVKYGVWIDFAAPLLAIQCHRIVKSLEEYFERKSAAHVS